MVQSKGALSVWIWPAVRCIVLITADSSDPAFLCSVCIGSNVAERSIFINCAILLWAFDFEAPDGDIGKVDTLAFSSAANSHPLPFKA
jgi:hypothetical protein